MIVAVIAFASLWPVLLATVHGFRTIDPRLIEVSRLLGCRGCGICLEDRLAQRLPDIFAGVRLAITVR